MHFRFPAARQRCDQAGNQHAHYIYTCSGQDKNDTAELVASMAIGPLTTMLMDKAFHPHRFSPNKRPSCIGNKSVVQRWISSSQAARMVCQRQCRRCLRALIPCLRCRCSTCYKPPLLSLPRIMGQYVVQEEKQILLLCT
jgi:hypothetical protein